MYKRIQEYPIRWPDPLKYGIIISNTAKDLIEKLLNKDRMKRLGQKADVDEVLAHPFFKDKVDIGALLAKKVKPEFIPVVDSTSINNFDESITKGPAEETDIPAEAQA